MRRPELLEYAQNAIGFPIDVGQIIAVEEECDGLTERFQEAHTQKGAEAEVVSITMNPLPDQLTIWIRIFLDSNRDESIDCGFSEADGDPSFPFVRVMTQTQIEEERAAEAAKKEEAKKKIGTQNSGRLPGDTTPLTEEEWKQDEAYWADYCC